MAKTTIPGNSLLSTEFSKVWIRPTRRPNRYKLILGGEELNTVWFQDRPLRGYGHFQFDEITGRKAWKRLFSEDNPNSILSGNGNSLAFETGHFSSKEDGRFVSRIKPLTTGTQKQDVITGRWLNSSLLIDSTNNSDDNDNLIVKGLAGLLVVGGGYALFKKIRANRVEEAIEENIDIIQNDIDAAKSKIAETQADLQANEANLAQNTEKLRKLQATLTEYQDGLANAEKQLELARKFGGNQELIELWQTEINELQNDIIIQQDKILPVSAENESLVADSLKFKQDIAFNNKTVQILEKNKEALDELGVIIEDELEESLNEVAANANPFESQAFEANRAAVEDGEVDEVKLLNNLIEEDNEVYTGELRNQLTARIQGEYTDAMRNAVDNAIESGNEGALKAFVEATCEAPLSAMRPNRLASVGVGGACTDLENIDPIVELYSEEFTIEENVIFKDSNVFKVFRNDLADVGYEAEVGELVEYVAGPEFADEAGGLIGAFTEGSLVAEEAVGALDIASIGLGGEAFVDGLALEVGGEALLGEIALDLLEIAVFL
jgi:hypothetical protein